MWQAGQKNSMFRSWQDPYRSGVASVIHIGWVGKGLQRHGEAGQVVATLQACCCHAAMLRHALPSGTPAQSCAWRTLMTALHILKGPTLIFTTASPCTLWRSLGSLPLPCIAHTTVPDLGPTLPAPPPREGPTTSVPASELANLRACDSAWSRPRLIPVPCKWHMNVAFSKFRSLCCPDLLTAHRHPRNSARSGPHPHAPSSS